MLRAPAACRALWLLALMQPAAGASVATGGHEGSGLKRKPRVGASFLRTLQFKHRLRVCNAYPLDEAVDVYQGEEKLTEEPIHYEACHEVTSSVKTGDRLQFSIGGRSAGSFAVSELPNNDAVLVLVIYRHDSTSAAVAFESHVFANLINAQIAVLDTYRGTKKATLHVQDASGAKTSRSEELRFDSVVSVNQGMYEVVLQGEDGEIKAKQELIALNRESYVIIRCGVEDEDGQAYKQELMVYPRSDPKVLMGAAPVQCTPLLLALLLAAWVTAVTVDPIAGYVVL